LLDKPWMKSRASSFGDRLSREIGRILAQAPMSHGVTS
jgi:hypothetical protein